MYSGERCVDYVKADPLDYKQNNLTLETDTLKEIYDSSLIVLYRLLFILYAEARGLLPVRESEQYRDSYSLQAVKESVAHDLDAGKLLLPTSARLWPTLTDLFGIIDAGSPPLKVATFNGGLFDPARHPFLARHTVGDAHLQRAIDKLARVKGQFVDYRDLAEQHLGTIYEGLLEYQLRPDDSEDGWTVALLNDKGERHATGSYYTPDYIVKYMVDATLAPVLRAVVCGTRSDAEKVARVLAVNVLDPAMGSGHFLVEATAYIARFLVELGVQESEGGDEADVAYWRRRVAQSCIYGVDLTRSRSTSPSSRCGSTLWPKTARSRSSTTTCARATRWSGRASPTCAAAPRARRRRKRPIRRRSAP